MKVDLYKEEHIISGCQKGDRRFQEILYRQFAPKMYGICISYAGDRALAQDMLQEAFVKVFKNIKQFKGEGSFEGWIRRIVVNTSIDTVRKTGNINKLTVESDSPKANSQFTDNLALPNMQLKELMGYISKLPEGARVIFNLFALEGYTHKEIARELNISEGTSKSQYNRARGMLQDWLGKLND